MKFEIMGGFTFRLSLTVMKSCAAAHHAALTLIYDLRFKFNLSRIFYHRGANSHHRTDPTSAK